MIYRILVIVLLTQSLFLRGQRIEQTLNSAWSFSCDSNPNAIEIVNLPHTWNKEDAFQDGKKYYRGIGTYTKRIYFPIQWKGKRIYIKFEGANQLTKVRINNEFIGEHRGGYTGFIFDLTESIYFGKENILKVEVDNRHNSNIPPLEADFNFYGGIYRDVFLIVSDPLHFDVDNEALGNLLVSTPEVSAKKASLKIEGKVANETEQQKTVQVRVSIHKPDGSIETEIDKSVKIKAGNAQSFSFDYEINLPELWSPESPSLYKLEAFLTDSKTKKQFDRQTTTFGCRWFNIDPEKGFYLNGKSIKLIGVNRHQDFEGLGNALPNALHERDLRLIKDMGSNFVRIAHYPQDPEVYRMCDELGLLVWSEIPVINEITNSQEFTDVCLKIQREQVLQFFNHPSIIMWGYMNEIFIRMVFNRKMTDEEKNQNIVTTIKLAKELEAETKKLDPKRYTAMALHNNNVYNTSGIADIPDIIGWNLYFGWYDKTLDDLGVFLDEQHKKYPTRPIIISEYGPGADVRIHTDNPKPWDYSEAFQLKSHRSYFKQVYERPYILGMTAWNFADFGSQGRQDAKPYINQKGLVEFNRKPKDVYQYYKAMLIKEPFVYIAGENRDIHYCSDGESGKLEVSVTVFSSLENVSLRVNDSMSINLRVQQGVAVTTLELEEGIHMLAANANGYFHNRTIKVLRRSQVLANLKENPLKVNVGSHCDYTDPLTREVWINDQEYTKSGWGFIGGNTFQQSKNKFQGTPINILGTLNDPLFQTMQENINAYKFDVEKGEYKVTLLFAEHNLSASEELIYNLSEQEQKRQGGVRIFSLLINGEEVKSRLNLAKEYGKGIAVELSYIIYTEGDILVEFKEIEGSTILSGIKLEKIN